MRIVGNPGGLLHLRDGLVVAVDSPGSPGAETLLLGSGRVREIDWTAALADSVETRSLRVSLVARKIVEDTEIEGIATAVMQDGTFAIAAGEIELCFLDGSVDRPLLPASDGVTPELLLSETARRLDEFASLPFSLSPYRDRVMAAGGPEPDGLTGQQREIIANATGRRSARDIAFVLGRSLHAVTVDVAGMLGDGLLEIAPPALSFSFSQWGPSSLRPREEAGQRPSEVEC